MTMNELCVATLALLLSASSVTGFHIPSPFLAKHAVVSSLTTQTPALLFNDAHAMMTPDGEARWASLPMRGNNLWLAEGGALDVVRNIALGITAILFLLAGVTFLYASFIIPAAAQELEKECKELDPQLWEQYQAKMGEGETMATRPDLMQELGAKLQPLLEAKLAAMDNAGMPSPLETTMNPMASRAPAKSSEPDIIIPTTSPDQWDDGIIDVTVEKPKKDDKN